MKKFIFINLVLASLFFTSCDRDNICISGQGSSETKTIDIADFTGIDLSLDADVIISQGSTQEVRVTGHTNIIDRLETRVNSDIWDIKLDGRCFRNFDLTIFITVPNISEVYLTGSGRITINDFFNQAELTTNISGSGAVFLNQFDGLNKLSSKITGSGEIIANKEISSVNQLNVVIRGSGEFRGFAIHSNLCNVKITGSGDCEVRAADNLDVTISGSGDVLYKGRPLINQKITGSGNIKDAN